MVKKYIHVHLDAVQDIRESIIIRYLYLILINQGKKYHNFRSQHVYTTMRISSCIIISAGFRCLDVIFKNFCHVSAFFAATVVFNHRKHMLFGSVRYNMNCAMLNIMNSDWYIMISPMHRCWGQ